MSKQKELLQPDMELLEGWHATFRCKAQSINLLIYGDGK